MSETLDQLVNVGLKLLDDANNPSEAHSEHEYWVQDVNRWLQEISPDSGLSAEWAAFGSSPLVYGGAYYDDPRAWVSHLSLIRRRLKWLSEKGPSAVLKSHNENVKRVIAKLTALRKNVASRVDFAWPDLHYHANLTLEFLQRYEKLRDEVTKLQPDLYSDLPRRDLPENPETTADGQIAGHIPSYYLKTLLEDIDYILEIHSQLGEHGASSVSKQLEQIRGESVPWDVFISHASEDKAAVAEPLTNALMDVGLMVWYDTIELKIGDSLRGSIDKGLRESRFGVIILSPAFFGKHWPTLELNGLAQKEVNGEKVILPVWYNIGVDDVRSQSPLLADRVAAQWATGIESVVASLLKVIQPTTVHNKPAHSTLPPDPFKELAMTSPKTAMMETWNKLVSAISDAAKRSQPPGEIAEPMTPSEIVNQLFQAAEISDENREEFFRLKKWHDSTALWHVHQEPKDALGFAELTNELVRVFSAI